MLTDNQKENRIGKIGGSDFRGFAFLEPKEYKTKENETEEAMWKRFIKEKFMNEKANKGFYKMACKIYFEGLNGFRLNDFGEEGREITAPALSYGNKNESLALEFFKKSFDFEEDKQFNINDYQVASVDGINKKEGFIVEVKCCSMQNFAINLENDSYLKECEGQMQYYMHYLKIPKCYFVAFNHQFKRQIKAKTVEYDEFKGKQIEFYCNKVIEKIKEFKEKDY